MTQTVAEMLDAAEARTLNSARWVAACGGTEAPMTVNGTRVLYCWNSLSGRHSRHAYINLDTDIEMTDAEFDALCGR